MFGSIPIILYEVSGRNTNIEIKSRNFSHGPFPGGQISRFVPIIGFVELAAPAPELLYQLDIKEESWTIYY